MCTVTWLREDDGYQLFCNRDEKRTRKPALPPQLAARNGVRYIAPVDGDFGGTWIATNEFGVSLCLLNGKRGSSKKLRSRGLLVLDLISFTSAVRVRERLERTDLFPFAPFTLAAIEPGRLVEVIDWDGVQVSMRTQTDRYFMLTSSSFDTEKVQASRRYEFARMTQEGCDAARLLAFHHSHQPARSAYSPCMHRPDAHTVSFTRVHVTSQAADFEYSPVAPCRQI